jgi:hypothetical protein
MAGMVPAAQLLIALGVFMAGIGVIVWAGSGYARKKAPDNPPPSAPETD